MASPASLIFLLLCAACWLVPPSDATTFSEAFGDGGPRSMRDSAGRSFGSLLKRTGRRFGRRGDAEGVPTQTQTERLRPLHVSPELMQRAMAWAARPNSICFQGADSTQPFDLTLVTISSSDISNDILTCVRKNRLLLALAQGHQYCHFYPADPSRAITWSKLIALKQVLPVSKNVFWLDSDAIITRFDIPLLPYLLSLARGRDAVFTTDFDTLPDTPDRSVDFRAPYVRMNAGVLFLRSTNWTMDMLDRIYRDSPDVLRWGDFCEQHGISDFRSNFPDEWKTHARIVHYRYMNTWYAYYKPGALIYHYAGGWEKRDKYPSAVMPMCMKANMESPLAHSWP